MSKKGQGRLRQIAVHVEEPRFGAFEWVLSESLNEDRAWDVLQRARHAAKTYQASMAEGLMALQSMIDDLAVGPRSEGPERDRAASAMGESGAAAPAPSRLKRAKAPAQSAGRTVFGFGVME